MGCSTDLCFTRRSGSSFQASRTERCKVGSGAEPESVHSCLFRPYTLLIIVSRLLPPHPLPHVACVPLFFPSYSHTSSNPRTALSGFPISVFPLSRLSLGRPISNIQNIVPRNPFPKAAFHRIARPAPTSIFSFILSCPVLPCPSRSLSLSSIQLAPNIRHHPASIPRSS